MPMHRLEARPFLVGAWYSFTLTTFWPVIRIGGAAELPEMAPDIPESAAAPTPTWASKKTNRRGSPGAGTAPRSCAWPHGAPARPHDAARALQSPRGRARPAYYYCNSSGLRVGRAPVLPHM